MTAQERLAQSEAIEMARWLSPLPDLQSKLAPDMKTFDEGAVDQALGNAFGTDGSRVPDLGPLSEYENWPSVAAVIDRKIQQLTSFEPTNKEFNEIVWENYAHKFRTMPFLVSKTEKKREATISSLSLSKAVEAIEDIILAIATQNTYLTVATSFKKIAQLAIENSGATQKDNMQQQGILSIKSSLLYVGYLRTSVEMVYKSGKGYEQLTQKLSIESFSGILDFSKCKREASTLMSWDGSDVDEWATNTSSQPYPPNNSPAWNN